jgi:aspartate aminotransferase-like enzyme
MEYFSNGTRPARENRDMAQDHKYLMTPGPVEVRAEILQAQTDWMIGHRSQAFAELFASLQEKLKHVFFTQNRVYVCGSSGTGLWEGASRNAIRDDKRALHLVGRGVQRTLGRD